MTKSHYTIICEKTGIRGQGLGISLKAGIRNFNVGVEKPTPIQKNNGVIRDDFS